MNPIAWIILSFIALLAWAFLVRWLLNNPRGDLFTGIFYRLMKLDAFVFHRMRVFGRENIPDLPARHPGPLIIVINHTAGIDPVLVQAALHFEVRWMMARDMMVPALKALWDWSGAIPVDRGGRDTGSARDAIRYVRSGHAIGIFPEGGIERPPRTLLPFHPGVGFIIAKTEAPVLPVIVEGTPVCPNAWGSLYTRGRARVTFLPLRTYAGLKPAEITAKLQQDYLDATGWPLGERAAEQLD